MGQFLRAMILRDKELREEMRRNLNGGRPGWNSDEPAVVELACQRFLRLLFDKEDAADSIAEFLNLVELSAAENPPIDRPKVEMLIREMIGEANADAKGIPRSPRFVLQGMMAPLAAFRLELDEGIIDLVMPGRSQIPACAAPPTRAESGPRAVRERPQTGRPAPADDAIRRPVPPRGRSGESCLPIPNPRTLPRLLAPAPCPAPARSRLPGPRRKPG
jgi:hypothetical protein